MAAPERPLIAYIASQELVKVSSRLPSNKQRSALIHSLISAYGLLSSKSNSSNTRLQVINPRRASATDLAVYHTKDYLDYVLDNDNLPDEGRSTELGLEDDCPKFSGLAEYVQLVGGASLTAVAALKVASIAICWDGGRHHAQKSKAAGFCYVADCVLSILALKKLPPVLADHQSTTTLRRKTRVMYLDLDLHFSDAVSQAFHTPGTSNPSQVLTLSIHHSSPGFFPVSPLASLPSLKDPSFDPFTLSLPLKQGASAQAYLTVWPHVDRIHKIFRPDYIVLQCGVDGLAGDPCGIFNWSLGDQDGSFGWFVQQVLTTWSGKKLMLGGGGYNSPNAARAFTYLTSLAVQNPIMLDMDIPDHGGFPQYGPSFTLDVPAGNMQDHNTAEYLTEVGLVFDGVSRILEQRMGVSTLAESSLDNTLSHTQTVPAENCGADRALVQ